MVSADGGELNKHFSKLDKAVENKTLYTESIKVSVTSVSLFIFVQVITFAFSEE
jgi:hypothetical protein